MNSAGICGSDMHIYVHGKIADRQLDQNPKQVLGHEGSGTVVKIGSSVTNVAIGDRVAIEPNISCGNCGFCKSGRINLCPTCLEIPPNQGMFQQYFIQQSNLVHKIPDNLTFEHAAIAEPLACALHAVKRASIIPGQNVLITGCGAIGLLSLLGAKAFGADIVVVTDVIKSKIDHAVSIGATAGYVVDGQKTIADQASDIRSLFKGSDPDVTLECSGFESAMQLSIECTKPGGKVALVGLGEHFVKVPLIYAIFKELDIIGCSKYVDTYELGLKLMSSGKIDPIKVITHRFDLRDFKDAFDTMSSGVSGKVIMKCE